MNVIPAASDAHVIAQLDSQSEAVGDPIINAASDIEQVVMAGPEP
jgi:hypothetical protein